MPSNAQAASLSTENCRLYELPLAHARLSGGKTSLIACTCDKSLGAGTRAPRDRAISPDSYPWLGAGVGKLPAFVSRGVSDVLSQAASQVCSPIHPHVC